jgi:hypothetical protein
LKRNKNPSANMAQAFYTVSSTKVEIHTHPSEALKEWKTRQDAGESAILQSWQQDKTSIWHGGYIVTSTEQAERFDKQVASQYRAAELRRIIAEAKKELDDLKK